MAKRGVPPIISKACWKVAMTSALEIDRVRPSLPVGRINGRGSCEMAAMFWANFSLESMAGSIARGGRDGQLRSWVIVSHLILKSTGAFKPI